MQNIGEEIAGEYLKIVKGCDFVQYNLHTPGIQGEIDVIGINIKEKSLYICEVAIHLVTGLQYVSSEKKTDNVKRFLKKFHKDIQYANKYFKDYQKHFMLWSPVVKNQSERARDNQLRDVKEVAESIRNEHGYDLELVINRQFQKCLDELRNHAKQETKELKSPVLRLLQIEEKLKQHLKKLKS
jgi:Holliday junction resolvase-like predicted endonuclease